MKWVIKAKGPDTCGVMVDKEFVIYNDDRLQALDWFEASRARLGLGPAESIAPADEVPVVLEDNRKAPGA